MLIFRYTSQSKEGKTIGVITAENRHEAEKILRHRGEIILRMDTVSSGPEDSPFFTLRARSGFEKYRAKHKIGKGVQERFLHQLSILLTGGVPILSALQTLAMQEGHLMKRATFCLANKIRDGISLSQSLQQEMPFLGDITIGLIAAGELNGETDKMCEYAAQLIRRRRAIQARLIQALTYPAIVLVVLIGVLSFLFLLVIPQIMKFLSKRNSELPGITQVLVNVVTYVNTHWEALLFIPCGIIFGLYLLHKIKPLALIMDFIIINIPIFGKVFRASSNAMFTRILGTLLRSGINIISALNYAKRALSNQFYASEIKVITDLVSMGHPLSTGLRVSHLHKYIPMAESMITVGENTGHIDEGLIRISEFAEEELDRRIGLLSKLIEPILFLIIGGIVGFVYIAFFVAIMSLSKSQSQNI